jgi:hypothetical protein
MPGQFACQSREYRLAPPTDNAYILGNPAAKVKETTAQASWTLAKSFQKADNAPVCRRIHFSGPFSRKSP